MAKEKAPRALKDNEAKAVARMLRVSPQKLNLLAQLIRGKKVEKALADLEFSRKRSALMSRRPSKARSPTPRITTISMSTILSSSTAYVGNA